MEKNPEHIHQNGLKIPKELPIDFQNITCLDLSANNYETLEENIVLPVNLLELNLSNNQLKEVPTLVMKLRSLKRLSLAQNNIDYFDNTPSFCHTLEWLDLSNNKLKGPPHWVWTESPQKLIYLNLSYNSNIFNSQNKEYVKILLQFTNGVQEMNIQNCGLNNFLELIGTCTKLKSIRLGSEHEYSDMNSLIELPFKGLEKCCDIEKLDVSNTYIYNVNERIDVFKNIVELNVSYNAIHCLPNEFCNLINLEICVLSCNKILCIPDSITKLSKLRILLLDSNELCMFPNGICSMPNIETLDLYDNYLYEIPENYCNMKKFDIAQNYLDEPESDDYVDRKNNCRVNKDTRHNGRKREVIKSESEHSQSSMTEDEDHYYNTERNDMQENQNSSDANDDLSENWDSDEYWIPWHQKNTPLRTHSRWVLYVKKKLEEGNFCPVDTHVISVAEKVKYEQSCNPPIVYESDGQFDDYSSDDS